MMKKGLVSVVTPVYNGEAYVSRLLDSVLGQTYPEIEMILVDDGSTDGTAAAAEAYQPKFTAKGYSLRVVRAPHRNASGAINGGLCYVGGEYLVWPDADDELHPESIEKRVRFLEGHPEYCCVRSVMEYVSAETGETLPSWEKLGDLAKEDLFWDVLEGQTFVCCGCYMLKTEEFFQIYPARKIPEYEVGQNFQMLLPFLFRHRCPTMQEKLYRVWVRTDSHSRQKRSEAEEECRLRRFEELAGEILRICGLDKDRAAVDRVKLWTTRRRSWHAYRYRHFFQLARYESAVIWLRFKCRMRQPAGG